ncbi:SusC/RagA family TonB-linked outer membrane protein [Marinilabilia salmonicolor]|uniref:SusC/RagA family TonB-linked outer membrane protein n=1 Tax=Marinilabilia salmonicolor TaxID=989 RepID=UPI00029AD19E|nr:TonB-dependent receptor [Marinilabilia salmonicolor]
MKKIRSFLEGDLLKKVKSGGRKILTGIAIALGATFLSASVALAQDAQTVNGTVTDSQNLPLPGVNVVIKGTLQGTITDVDGNYELQASSEDVLQFSFIGFTTQEVPVGNQTTINVSLVEQASDLDEVIVVGYGVKQKSLVTGAISSVNAEDLENTSNSRVEQALQGRTAGVTVLPSSGSPGAGANVRIRGTGSNNQSEPLYIVDGMKVGSIDNIAPGDIESIEVLKDAASSAIYGSEGGNGVVLITTKTGKKGAAQVSYNFQYGIQSVRTDMELMNAQEYVQFMQEAEENVTVPTGVGNGTDWLDKVFEDAPMQSHHLNFSGGGEKSNYLASVSYNQQDGVVGGDKASYERMTFRFNASYDVKEWLEVGNTLSYSHATRKTVGEDDEYRGVLNNALLMDPTTPVSYAPGQETDRERTALEAGNTLLTDENGGYYALAVNATGEIANPVARLQTYNNNNTNDQLMGTLYANLKPVEGLTITSRLGLDLSYNQYHEWRNKYYFSQESVNSTNTVNDNLDKYFNWLWENFASYNLRVADHDFTVMAGFSAEKRSHPDWSMTSSPMVWEGDRYAFHSYTSSHDNDRIFGDLYEETMTSVYGRLSYSYLSKYLIEASVRRDAAAVFPEGDKGAVFPAVSAGWVVSEEDFWNNDFMSFLKLRFSWGQNGSTSILNGLEGEEFWTTSGIQYPGSNESGYYSGAQIEQLTNEDLKWERSEQISIGADMRFLNQKLSFSADYYDKQTKDLIVRGLFPLSVGNQPPYVNAGDVSNSGLELELGYNDQIGDLSFGANVNLSTLKNEVTYLGQDAPVRGANVRGYDITWFAEGEPIWYFSGYKTDGINPETGMPNVVDVNEDGRISDADQTNIGDPHPDLLYGASLNLAYKGLDFRMFLQGTKGNDIYTAWYRPDRPRSNKPKYFFTDRWTPDNTNASMPRAPRADLDEEQYIYRSDLMIQDGSYMRIKQLQLGYSFPQSVIGQMGLSKARVFVSLDDYFTFTDYKGLDPEAGSTNIQTQGVDRGVYPIPGKVLFGLSVNF